MALLDEPAPDRRPPGERVPVVTGATARFLISIGDKIEALPITLVGQSVKEASWVSHGFAGEPMARNFGVPHQTHRESSGSVWPILLAVSILVGAINIAAHLYW
ncbi:MAG: hypothetical protein KGK16_15545 [Bradyrhizobium sp.]|nr:hypothetical protein [Bradyrhizobium sp.]